MSGKRIAFYAPLKAPDHPVPSGDRQMARLLLRALDLAGFDVELASGLRSFDGRGDPARQQELRATAAMEVERLLAHYEAWPNRRPDLWVSYHLYYKAPDLIGPAVAGGLGIPYVVVEATRARKRLTGPWAVFAEAAEAAIAGAALVLCVSRRDRQAVEAYAPAGQRIAMLPPFIDLPPSVDRPPPGRLPRLLTVAMMRPGDKLASYRLLAQALGLLEGYGWMLEVVGAGEEAVEVAALLAPFGDRVRMVGALAPETLPERYRSADLMLWPGLNEAFGMVYLESQAVGTPVVAVEGPGTATVVRHEVGGLLTDPTPAGYAAAVGGLLAEPDRLALLGHGARRYVAEYHALPAAADRLHRLLTDLLP